MRNCKLIFIFLFLFTSCRTQQWYTEQVAVGDIKFTGWLASICADKFQVSSDTVIKYTERYSPANNISYQDIIDSLQIVSLNHIEPLPANDTCIDKVAPYLSKISKLNQYINLLKTQYKECKPDTVFKYQNKIITVENTARVDALKIENNGTASSLNSWRNAAFIFGVLFIVSLLIIFFTLKRMK